MTRQTKTHQTDAGLPHMPHVLIVATGGTIASSAGSSTQLTDYRVGLTAEEIIAAVPNLTDFARISAEQVANVPSSFMTLDDWLRLAGRINALLGDDGVDGVVVTHGTDTMEETAYFLNLVIKSHKAVVLAGAMRPASAISADGPLNLLQAVAVAAAPAARGKGVLVVMNGEINGARDVTKTSTTQVQTFTSHDLGFMGYVVDYKPVFYKLSSRRHTLDSEFDVRGLGSLPKVEIIYNYVDPGLEVVEAVINAGAAGIVSAGTGHGSVFNHIRSRLKEAVAEKGIAVVRSSRVGTGVVSRKGYDDTDNFIVSDSLNPQKARILLMLALTVTSDPQRIQQMFAEY